MDLLLSIVADGGREPLASHAARLSIPPSTAYRMVAALARRGLVAPSARGHYVGGLGLAGLAARVDRKAVMAGVARPLLRRLARQVGATAHLGVWEGDMVTYLVKEPGRTGLLFTREGGQLEAYCSAIGKVLLASLPAEQREAYLGAGSFVPLTDATIIEPDRLRQDLDRATSNGFATDQCEVAEDLYCVAVPVRRRQEGVVAAISLSWDAPNRPIVRPPPGLRQCARAIGARLG